MIVIIVILLLLLHTVTVEGNNNKDTETIVDEGGTSSDPSSETDLSIAPESIEMSEIKQSIEQVDTWSAQKLGIQ